VVKDGLSKITVNIAYQVFALEFWFLCSFEGIIGPCLSRLCNSVRALGVNVSESVGVSEHEGSTYGIKDLDIDGYFIG
jgi:hypothetical protein